METSEDFSLEIVVNLPKYKSLAIPVEPQRAIDTAPQPLKDIAEPFELSKSMRGNFSSLIRDWIANTEY